MLGNRGPVFGEYLPGKLLDLHLPGNLEASSFKAQIKAADSAEETTDGQLSHGDCSFLLRATAGAAAAGERGLGRGRGGMGQTPVRCERLPS